MAVDIAEIELTDAQKRRIAAIAERTGRPWREVLDEQLASSSRAVVARCFWSNDRYIEDREKRRAHFREWLSQQTSHNPDFDDSRESIYD